MHGITFLQDLAVVMIVAGLVTVLFHRLKQPVVLGYILAGVIIGEHTPPFRLIHDEETVKTLAELGIIFLMFSLGLEFNLRKLKQVGLTAVLAAVLEILLMLGVGYALGRAFGWSRGICGRRARTRGGSRRSRTGLCGGRMRRSGRGLAVRGGRGRAIASAAQGPGQQSS